MGRRSFASAGPGIPFDAMQDYFHAMPVSTLPDLAGNDYSWWDEMMARRQREEERRSF